MEQLAEIGQKVLDRCGPDRPSSRGHLPAVLAALADQVLLVVHQLDPGDLLVRKVEGRAFPVGRGLRPAEWPACGSTEIGVAAQDQCNQSQEYDPSTFC